MIKLKNRLKAVYNELNDNSSFADIGCDHGKLSAYALQTGKATKVIAVDISHESLQKTKILQQKLSLKNLETRVGDGLQVVNKGEVDQIVIAGMGGMEIIKILSMAEDKPFDKYIFVPHNSSKELRLYLMDKFLITKDYLIKENDKYYDVIVAKKGKSNLTKRQIEFGQNKGNSLLTEVLTSKLSQYEKYLQNARLDSEKQLLQSKIQLIREELNDKSK